MTSNSRENDFDLLVAEAAKYADDGDAELLDSLDDSDVSLSAETVGKVDKMINRKAAAKRAWRRAIMSASAVAAAIVIMLTAVVMNASAHPMTEWDTICDRYEYFYVVRYAIVLEGEDGKPLEVILPPKTVETKKRPDMPRGSREELIADTDAEFSCSYYDGAGVKLLEYDQRVLNLDGYTAVTSRGATVTDVDVGGYSGLLFTYSQSKMKFLFFNDSRYAYRMTSDALSSAELINIASKLK